MSENIESCVRVNRADTMGTAAVSFKPTRFKDMPVAISIEANEVLLQLEPTREQLKELIQQLVATL